jgi:endonuclease III-like uncharacterized protein
MVNLLINDVVEYVENNIPVFHEKRLAKIATLKLKEVLRKKNPYLFKVKYLQTASEIIELFGNLKFPNNFRLKTQNA